MFDLFLEAGAGLPEEIGKGLIRIGLEGKLEVQQLSPVVGLVLNGSLFLPLLKKYCRQ